MNLRIGFGYDVHQLKKDRKLILGGTLIPFDKGPLAHSDGDVLIHAICDSLLGALALGDIGVHFPDKAAEFKDIDSRILLKKTIQMIHEKGYLVGNIDSTICLQTPKLADYIPDMQKKLAEDLDIDVSQISIKATTSEHLGFIGKGKGISAYAVALLTK